MSCLTFQIHNTQHKEWFIEEELLAWQKEGEEAKPLDKNPTDTTKDLLSYLLGGGERHWRKPCG
jgi:hypothetical protein